MTHPHPTPSRPLCPTCRSELSNHKDLKYFAKSAAELLAADDVLGFYEETSRLIHFLGAIAEAGSCAAAEHAVDRQDTPGWVEWLSALGEELTKEAVRRLDLLRDAAGLWEARAHVATASDQTAGRKEG